MTVTLGGGKCHNIHKALGRAQTRFLLAMVRLPTHLLSSYSRFESRASKECDHRFDEGKQVSAQNAARRQMVVAQGKTGHLRLINMNAIDNPNKIIQLRTAEPTICCSGSWMITGSP